MSGAERDLTADGMIAVPAGLFGPDELGTDASTGADEVEATVVVTRRALRGIRNGGDDRAAELDAGEEFDAGEDFVEVEATVVVDRTGQTPHVGDDEVEATVVVDRSGAAPHPELDEATVVVERTGERGGAAAGSDPGSDAGESDAAAATDLAATDLAATDLAATVDRSASKPSMAHPAASVMHAPTRRSRRTPSRAPVSDAVLNTAEQGPGVGVLERYPSRPAEPLRIPVPDLGEGPAPTRDPERTLPSVARRTRRSALIGLGAVVLAAVLGAAGIVAIGVSVVGALFG